MISLCCNDKFVVRKDWSLREVIEKNILGRISEKKNRYLLSLAKKGGRVKAHDQNRKEIKNVVNGGR